VFSGYLRDFSMAHRQLQGTLWNCSARRKPCLSLKFSAGQPSDVPLSLAPLLAIFGPSVGPPVPLLLVSTSYRVTRHASHKMPPQMCLVPSKGALSRWSPVARNHCKRKMPVYVCLFFLVGAQSNAFPHSI
jgi:hypothetical protein